MWFVYLFPSSSIHRLTHFSGKSTLLKVLGGQVKSGYFEGTYQKHILLRGFELVSEKVKSSFLFSNLIDLAHRKGLLALFVNMEQELSSQLSQFMKIYIIELVYFLQKEILLTRSTRPAPLFSFVVD
jgi:hypothetical protein